MTRINRRLLIGAVVAGVAAACSVPRTVSASNCALVEGTPCLSGKPTFAYQGQFFTADGRPLGGVTLYFNLPQAEGGKGTFHLPASDTGSFCFRWYRQANIQVSVTSIRSQAPPDRRFATKEQRRQAGIAGPDFIPGAPFYAATAPLAADAVVPRTGSVPLQRANGLMPLHLGPCPTLEIPAVMAPSVNRTSHLEWLAIGAGAVLAVATLILLRRRRS
jgi:hypothetical protein